MRTYSFVNERYASAPGSPIRELKQFSELPGMISLAGGYPAPELMDAGGLQQIFSRFASAEFGRALEYGGTEGAMALRVELARLSSARDMAVEPADVLTLSGSQQGIDLLARTLLSPGERVLVEAPTYPAALSAFRFAGASIHQIATDDEGLVIDAFEAALLRLKPKLLYIVPSFGNPSGRTLGEARRRALLALAVRHRCLVVEDDPYGELYFDQAPPPSLYGLRQAVDGAERMVIYLSSLSKTLAPGLRLGWMLGPADVRRACVLAKQTDDMHASTLTQAAAAAYLKQGLFLEHLPQLRRAYAARAQALVRALREHLGERIRFTEPGGGMFVWARLPGVDSTQWLKSAIERRVMFVPGAAFFAQAPDPACFRLSFASQDEAGLALGVTRLAEALRSV
ncbi:PLP-dependent aminotransferase family protein [Variovorax paradoxus]|nr:PLP-dependent aminotransferase family protein [Variovorax paradoxus]